MASLLDVLGYAGNALDLPGSSVRDLLTGNNPFDQWLTPFSDQNRATGRDVLAPLLGANEETGMAGWLDNPMEGLKDVAGFGAEVLLDPTNLIPGRAVLRAMKGRKAAKAINAGIDAENIANAGKYAMVNPKVQAVEELVNPITGAPTPQRLLGYTPAPEDPMFPGVELMHHGGHDMSASATASHPYGIFDLGRLKTGEGNNMFGPGAYKADVEDTSAFYRDLVQKDLDEQFRMNPDTLRSYFAPGNIVDGYAGKDKVLAFNEDGGSWSVQVQRVDENGVATREPPRWHFTTPDVKSMEKVLGPAARPRARLYKYDAPAGTKDRFLKWENSLREQPQAVQDLVGDPRSMFSPEQLQLIDQVKVASERLGAAGDRLAEFTSGNFVRNNDLVGNTPKEKARFLTDARKRAEIDVQKAQYEYQVLKSSLLDMRVPYDIATGRFEDLNDIDGETIADLLMGSQPSEATLADTAGMRAAGVPGVKNLAGSTGGQSYNYAIWDQDLLNSMRVREIDGVRVPINPTTLIQQQAVPVRRGIADSVLEIAANPMREKMEVPNALKPVVAGAVFNLLARQNNYGGAL